MELTIYRDHIGRLHCRELGRPLYATELCIPKNSELGEDVIRLKEDVELLGNLAIKLIDEIEELKSILKKRA